MFIRWATQNVLTNHIWASHLTHSLFLAAFAHLILELCANFLPVIYPILISEQGFTYAQIGFITLILGTSSSLAQPLFGYLSDWWGAGRMAALSIAWIGVVMGLTGFISDYLLLTVIVGLGALGSAAFHPAGAALASATKGKRRGAALSVFSVGGNVGAALSPLWVAIGLSWFGLPGTTVLIPVALLVSLMLYRMFSQKTGLDNKQPIITPPRNRDTDQQGWLMGLVLISIIVMCRSWFQVTLTTYLPEWLHSQGWSLTMSGQMLSIILVSMSVGSLIGGPLSDHIGRWPVLAMSIGLLGPAQWFFLNVAGPMQVGLISLMGVSIGLSFPVAIVLAQEVWPQRVGLASSLVLGLGWAPGGLGASFTGLVADEFSLTTGLQLLIISPFLGLFCVIIYALLQEQALKPLIEHQP